MRQTIDRRQCDHCGQAIEQSEVMSCGSPFSGWLRVERTDGSTRIPRADNGPWDFCGEACCIAFLSAGDGLCFAPDSASKKKLKKVDPGG